MGPPSGGDSPFAAGIAEARIMTTLKKVEESMNLIRTSFDRN
jgi:hypothetical protein